MARCMRNLRKITAKVRTPPLTQGFATPPQHKAFTAWASRFQKKYVDTDKYDAHIKSVNGRGLSYTLAHNHYSDLTADEFYAQHVGHQDTETYLASLGKHVHMLPDQLVSALPKSVDWTIEGTVTPVKNQGECGSCWAFPTTGSVEGAYAIASGKVVSLSEQQLVDCDMTDNGCKGGSMDNGYKWIEANGGICREKDYGYEAVEQPCRTTCKPAVTLGGYTDVPKGNETQLKVAVALGPVSVALEADKSIFQLASTTTPAAAGCLTTGCSS